MMHDDPTPIPTRLPDFPLTTPVRSVIARPPIQIEANATVGDAVQKMAGEGCSCLPIVDDTGRVSGIFTDRDLRSRVVARGLGIDTPLAAVMTADPIVIAADTYTFQALLTMSRHNIHHVPVVEEGRLIGVVTSTDLVRLQATSPVYFVGDIWKQNSVAGLQALSQRLPQLVRNLIVADAKAEDIGRIVTVFTDALTERLLQLAEATLGRPPVSYAWLAFGSQARQEQSAHSDQDNGLLLADEMAPEHDAYFADLARFVTDGLAACGYRYCDGEVMATNPRWRQPLAVWQGYFERWTMQPDPEALLNATIFFDMRGIAGDLSLFNELHRGVIERCRGNNRFLGNLAANALDHQPPLGFFGRFSLIKKGKHQNRLDLKHNGVVPIIDLSRIYALAYGVPALNTFTRIRDLIPTEAFVEADGRNLYDALEYIFYVRLQHQGAQLQAGKPVDNFVDPRNLSHFEREHLKGAFTIVRKMQNTLSQRYQTSIMR